VRLKAGCEALLLVCQLLLLVQEFLLLGDQTAHFTTQFVEFFLEGIDGFLRAGLFVFIMAAETVQQRFGLMIRVLMAAAHRARLVILQLCAQFLDAGTARQALAFQQVFGHRQGLFGHGQFGLGLQACLVQLLPFLRGIGELLRERSRLLVQLLLAVPQAYQVFEGTLLFAVVVQQTGQQLHLFGHGVGFGAGFLIEQVEGFALLGKFLCGRGGALFQLRQFGLAFFQAVADQHQLLQAVTVGVPGIAQRGEGGIALKFGRQALQPLGDVGVFVLQALEQGVAFGAGVFLLLFFLGALAQIPSQVSQGALCFKGLAQ